MWCEMGRRRCMCIVREPRPPPGRAPGAWAFSFGAHAYAHRYNRILPTKTSYTHRAYMGLARTPIEREWQRVLANELRGNMLMDTPLGRVSFACGLLYGATYHSAPDFMRHLHAFMHDDMVSSE